MSSRDDPSALGGAEAKAKSRSSLFPLASSYLNSSAPHRGLFPIPTQVHASNPALPGPSATWVADASFDSRLLPKPPAIPALALSQAGYSIERDAPDLGLRSHSEAGTETSTSSGEAEGEAEKAQGSKGLPLQAKVKEKESKKKSKSKSKRDRGRSSSEEDGEGGEGDRSQRRESKRRKKRRRKRRERGEEEEEREKRRLARRAREEEAAGREGIGSLAGSAVERKPAVSRWMESKALPPQEYYVDTRGDRDNLAFGSLYRLDVARFHRKFSSSAARADGGAGAGGGFAGRRRVYGGLMEPEPDGAAQGASLRAAVRYWSGKQAAKERSRELRRIRLGRQPRKWAEPAHAPAPASAGGATGERGKGTAAGPCVRPLGSGLGEFVPLEVEEARSGGTKGRKRRRRRGVEGGAEEEGGREGGREEEDEEAEEEEEEEGESWDAYLRRRTRELNERTRLHPHDVGAWLALADFQDECVRGVRAKGALQAAADKKAAVLSRALEGLPGSEALLLPYLKACALRDDAAALHAKWQRAIGQDPGSYVLWREYIGVQRSQFSSFSVPATLQLYTRAIQALTAARNRARREVEAAKGDIAASAQVVEAELAVVHFFMDACAFRRAAGHQEAALGTLQAQVEYAIFAPPIQVAESSKLRLFEAFWDGVGPRIGEIGAQGWATWLEREEESLLAARAPAGSAQVEEEEEEDKGGWSGWFQAEAVRKESDGGGGGGEGGGGGGGGARDEGEDGTSRNGGGDSQEEENRKGKGKTRGDVGKVGRSDDESDEGAEGEVGEEEVEGGGGEGQEGEEEEEDEEELLEKLGLTGGGSAEEAMVTDPAVWKRWVAEEEHRDKWQWLPMRADPEKMRALTGKRAARLRHEQHGEGAQEEQHQEEEEEGGGDDDDDDDGVQLERAVVFEDVREFLFSLLTPRAKAELLFRFVRFCDGPLATWESSNSGSFLSQLDALESLKSPLNLPDGAHLELSFERSPVATSGPPHPSGGGDQEPPAGAASSDGGAVAAGFSMLRELLGETPWFEKSEGRAAFVRNVMAQALQALPQSRSLKEGLLEAEQAAVAEQAQGAALEASSAGAGAAAARSLAKRLLKSQRQDLELWAAYAKLEAAGGHVATARKVLDTALSSLPALPQEQAASRAASLFLTYAELELALAPAHAPPPHEPEPEPDHAPPARRASSTTSGSSKPSKRRTQVAAQAAAAAAAAAEAASAAAMAAAAAEAAAARQRALHILACMGEGGAFVPLPSSSHQPRLSDASNPAAAAQAAAQAEAPQVAQTAILRARKGFREKLTAVRVATLRDDLDEGAAATVACAALFEELSAGARCAAEVFEDALSFGLPGRRRQSLQREQLCVRYAHMLLRNLRQIRPALARLALLRALADYPHSAALLAALVQLQARAPALSTRLRRLFDESAARAPSVAIWVYAVAAEIGRVGAGARVHSLLERALSCDATCHSVLLWRLYLAYELHVAKKPESARQVFFRAVHMCPWSKELWLDGFRQLNGVLSGKEQSELADIMREKELRVRTDIYEILLQDAEDSMPRRLD